jgi:SNF2 family DNA or RNA helicase
MTPKIVDPMPHQWEAIEEIVSRSALLVHHGTGTGKTRSAIEAIDVIVGAGEIPILHVVPNSLIEQTVEESTTWRGTGWVDRHLAVLDGKLSITQRAEALSGLSRWFSYGSVYLLSTEALSYRQIREGIRQRDWGAAFIDEGSRFRNYSARTRTLQVIGQKSRSRYVFSGNIMPRNPADLWYIMNFLVPRLFGTNNIQTFKSEYCILGGFTGMQVMGVRPDKIGKLKALVDAHSIRAELSDIRSDMPTRSLTVRRVSLKTGTQAETYRQMRDTLRAEIERMSAEEFRTQASTYSVRLLRLQEIAAGFSRNVEGDVEFFWSNKTEEMLDMLQDTPDQPTIIWYWWTPEKLLIEAELAKEGLPFITFEKAGDGSRDRFMRGEANIYISQLAKGAYGLNLTRATRMIYHSLPWDLDAYLQSQERNMRLTTTADHLEIEHLVVKGTVDEYVRQKLLAKAGISRSLSKSDALAMLK